MTYPVLYECRIEPQTDAILRLWYLIQSGTPEGAAQEFGENQLNAGDYIVEVRRWENQEPQGKFAVEVTRKVRVVECSQAAETEEDGA